MIWGRRIGVGACRHSCDAANPIWYQNLVLWYDCYITDCWQPRDEHWEILTMACKFFTIIIFAKTPHVMFCLHALHGEFTTRFISCPWFETLQKLYMEIVARKQCVFGILPTGFGRVCESNGKHTGFNHVQLALLT